MSWLKTWAGHLFLALIVLDRLADRLTALWIKIRPVEKFVERRLQQRRNTMPTWLTSIGSKIGVLTKIVPIVEAVVTEVLKDVPAGEADVAAAVAEVEKAMADAKTAFENLVAAVKAAAGNTPPAA
jgi:hypothetical protein